MRTWAPRLFFAAKPQDQLEIGLYSEYKHGVRCGGALGPGTDRSNDWADIFPSSPFPTPTRTSPPPLLHALPELSRQAQLRGH